MTDSRKTKQQLMQELETLRARLAQLENDAPAASAPAPNPVIAPDRFRQIIEKSPIGMVVADMDGYVRAANPAFCQMIGYRQEELRHILFDDLTHPEDQGMYPPLFAEIHAGNREDYSLQKRYIRRDGTSVWTSVHASVIRDATGLPSYYVAFIEDISAAREAEAQLQHRLQAEKHLSALSARFINLPNDRLDVEIQNALETLVRFIDVDEAFFAVIAADGLHISRAYQWHKPESCPPMFAADSLSLAPFPWLLSQLQQGRIVSLRTPADMPPAAETERAAMIAAGIRSMLSIPMMDNQSLLGYLGFATHDRLPEWSSDDTTLLKLTGEILLNAVARQRAGAALLDTNRLLRTLIDTIPDPAYVKDEASRFNVANTAVARIMGAAQPEELVGKTDYDFFPADLAAKYAADEARVMATEQPILNREEAGINAETGDNLWMLTTKAPLHNSSGQVIGIVGIAHDITQRKNAEEALRQAHSELESRIEERTADLSAANRQLRREIAERQRVEEALRRAQHEKETILNGLQGQVNYYDTDLNVLWLNKQARDYQGLTLEDAVGRPCHEVVWGRSQVCAECPVQRSMQTLEMEEYERHMSDGTIWTIRGYPIFGEHNEVVGAVELSVDITERKRIEKEAVRNERLAALGRLSASLAHEINNPLQIIQSHLDLVLDFPLSSEETRQYLQVTRKEIDRLSHITRSILDLARPHIDQGTSTRVDDVLQHVLAVTHNELDFQRIQVETDIQTTQPVRLSAELLQQICLNLILNAIEAVTGLTAKKLRITARQVGHHVLIEFSNNGPAIPPEDLDHVFEPFYTTKPGGSGLGLWRAYNLLKESGSLSVANLENDQWVTFTVTLEPAIVQIGLDNASTNTL